MSAQPLAHLRVLDLSRVLAGPWVGQLLGDLGAEVLKVERPGRGDDTRAWGPPWVGEDGPSAYFCAANRSKRSLAVDLKSEAGRALVLRLADAADVVVENYKPGTLARLGLGAEVMRARNPRLVVASISAFGLTGPGAGLPGYDLLVQAMSGLMSITGAADGPPTKVGVAITDLMTGMYAANGILAALAERERTGVGCHLDTSLYETQLAWLANQATNHLIGGVVPQRRGNAHPNIVPYQTFEVADGHLVVAVGNDGQFRAFCGAIGAPELADDPDYATNSARVAHRDRLVPELAARLRPRSRGHWVAALQAVGVPCGPVRDMAEAFADPVVDHLGGVVAQEVPAGVVRTPGVPLRFDGVRPSPALAPPGLDEGGAELAARWLGPDEG